MKRILLICMLLLITTPAIAWENPSKSAAPTQNVPAERSRQVTLENRRVVSIRGNTIVYNLGRKTITIQADCFAAREFIRDVQAGRRSAKATVTLVPERVSPFNTIYKAR